LTTFPSRYHRGHCFDALTLTYADWPRGKVATILPGILKIFKDNIVNQQHCTSILNHFEKITLFS
jgi:hypothetical protein